MIVPPPAAALVVSHPGHELRVHHWMERSRPTVFVLTDGSGHSGVSRLATTSAILRRAGASEGSVFGAHTDRGLYAAMLGGDVALFTALAATLAEAFLRIGATTVACDAEEGYNPSHDVCRYLSAAAVQLARQEGATIQAYDFPLVGSPTECADALKSRALWFTLDEAALDRKIDAARRYTEIAGDVEEALRTHGRDAFRVECLRPTLPVDLSVTRELPFYERHGARQVALGHYDRVLRFADHVLPIAAALHDLAPAAV